MKLWGPAKEKLQLSRPPPTPIDEIIEPENVLLLQFLYGGGPTHSSPTWIQEIFNFAIQVARVFSPSVKSLPLRYALLVFGGFILCDNSTGQMEMRNSSLARRCLLKRTAETLDEGDLFASAILALVAILNRIPNVDEGRVYANGFMTILAHLSTTSRMQNNSGLAMFRPMARSLVLLFANDLTYPDFFRYYSCCRAIIGRTAAQHRARHLNSEYAERHLYFIEDILVKAIETRLRAFDGGVEDQWVAQAVKDAGEDLQEVIASTLDETWRERTEVIGKVLRCQFCRTLLALLNTADITYGFLDTTVIDLALCVLEPLSLVIEHWRNSKDTQYRPDVPYMKRALSLCVLAVTHEFVLRSLFVNGERSIIA